MLKVREAKTAGVQAEQSKISAPTFYQISDHTIRPQAAKYT